MANQYSRFFITLTQDRPGYGLRGREPSGRAVIEVRNGFGKMTVSAQDMKTETIYRVYIIASRHNAMGVPAGMLNADARGRAELKWEFDPSDVEKTGVPIEDFDVAAVIVQSKTEPLWVLTGYKNEVVRFKESFKSIKELPEKADAPKPVIKAEPNDCAAISNPIRTDKKHEEVQEPVSLEDEQPETGQFEALQLGTEQLGAEQPEAMQLEAEQLADEQIEAEQIESKQLEPQQPEAEQIEAKQLADEQFEAKQLADEQIEAEQIESKQLEPQQPEAEQFDAQQLGVEQPEAESRDTKGYDSGDIHENFKAMAQSFNKKFDELENMLDINPGAKLKSKYRPKPESMTELDKIFDFNAKMTPFKMPADGVRWVRISQRELVFLNLNYWSYMNAPFVCMSYEKYRHLLLGERTEGDKKRYILGVPEEYCADSARDASRLGFKMFSSGDGMPPEHLRDGVYGYWLMEL